MNILEIWGETHSIRACAKETGYSWQKVVKILSTEGVIINDTHRKVLQCANKGMSTKEISKLLHHSYATVQAYIPRIRPEYGANQSENAVKLKQFRNKKLLLKYDLNCEKQKTEHDEYLTLKKNLREKVGYTTFGVKLAISRSNQIYIVGDNEEERKITIEEVKELLDKFNQVDELIDKLTLKTHIVY